MTNLKILLIAAFLCCVSFVSNAAEMLDIDPGIHTKSIAYTVSGNGGVVGISNLDDSSTYYDGYTYASGNFTQISNLAGSSYFAVTDMNQDGSVIVGVSDDGSGNGIATKYDVASGMQALGSLGGSHSWAYGVSDDGSIIAGSAINGDDVSRAFIYTDASGMTDIGTLGGGTSHSSAGYGISGNGNVIVGTSQNASSQYHAFKYSVDIDDMVDLGTLGGTTSSAFDVSYDGSIIVGRSDITGNTHYRAFKYSDADGMVDLGTLGGGNSIANAVSSDGSTIVGASDIASGSGAVGAFKYTDADGMVNLGTLGGDYAIAYAVSDDGNVIVGSSTTESGQEHAFIYRTTLVDLDETVVSLYKNNAQLNAIFNLKNSLIQSTLKQDCTKFGANNTCIGVGYRYSNNDNHNAQDHATNLRLAYKANDNVRVGIILDQSVASVMPQNFTVRNTMPTIGMFSNFSQSKDRGFNLRLSATYDNMHTTIMRDPSIYTEHGQGDADIKSYGMLAELSYNTKIFDNMTFKPLVGLRHTSVIRDGYVESANIDFPIAYETVKQRLDSVIIGFETTLTATSNLSFDFGIDYERNVNKKIDGYVGTINQIGSFKMDPYEIRTSLFSVNGGMRYDISDKSRFEITGRYGHQAFNDSKNAVIYANYLMGF